MARILDLGCGKGVVPLRAGATAADDVVGVDIDKQSLALARMRFPDRSFYLAAAERLPFANASFDRVVSGVALPYMDIPRALAEVRRVLVQGGSAFFSLHPLRLTVSELKKAWPRVVPTGFRLFVLLNGIVFYFTGRTLAVRGRHETFQTQRGIRLALEQAGFERIEFSRPEGRLIVQATACRYAPETGGAEARVAAGDRAGRGAAAQ